MTVLDAKKLGFAIYFQKYTSLRLVEPLINEHLISYLKVTIFSPLAGVGCESQLPQSLVAVQNAGNHKHLSYLSEGRVRIRNETFP